MFFIGIFGTNSKVVPAGQIPGSACPVCKQNVLFSVCRKYDYFHAFFIPVFKYGSVYIATCPSCASVFELKPELGKRLEGGGEVRVSPADLTLVRDNFIPRCPACGAPQQSGSLFCNKCGRKL